jgi:DNA (cytosine-5)-methyltransferase 1
VGHTNASKLAIRVLKEAVSQRAPAPKPEAFRFIDLFAGIGGKCVFTSEWDQCSQKTYSLNFPDDRPVSGDIREFSREPSRIPKHDVLLAGFPRQPFSIAGVSRTNALGRPHGFLCDAQGTLFFDTAQIIAHHRPAAFLPENVKSLESHDQGRTLATIMNIPTNELGYRVQHRVISSEPWAPQRRQRIFIAGFREPTGFDFASPINSRNGATRSNG